MKVALPSIMLARLMTRARLSLFVSMRSFLSSSMGVRPLVLRVEEVRESFEEWLEVIAVAELEALPAATGARRVNVWCTEGAVRDRVLREPVAHGGRVRDDVAFDQEVDDSVEAMLLREPR